MSAIIIALVATIPGIIGGVVAYFKLKKETALKLREVESSDRVNARAYTDRLIELTTKDVLSLRRETEDLRERVVKLEQQVNALKPWKSYARVLQDLLEKSGIEVPPEPVDYFNDED